MTWLDQLQAASFRGVPFQVETLEHSAGDNVVLREYPFSDLPTVFRMGEAAEEIKFSAYVIGADYITQRDALRAVLSGLGELVHPTAGRLQVFVHGRYTIKEAPTAEGGMARFDLVFVRAQARRYPVGVAATQATAATQASAAVQAAQDDFAAGWSLAGQPGWAADMAVARMGTVLGTAWGAVGPALQGQGEATNALTAGYQGLATNLPTLVSTPADLATRAATLFEVPDGLAQADALRLQTAFAGLFEMRVVAPMPPFEVSSQPAPGTGLVMYGTGTSGAVTINSAARAVLERSLAGIDRLFEVMATAAWVRATAQVELANYEVALAMRAAIHAQCLRLLTSASQLAATPWLAPTSLHDALLALHTAALNDLQSRSLDLARLTSYTPASVMPVWAVSWKLYGTTAWADEIMAMNPHIRHPLLVPAGQALRVVRHT
jgi:prophage DNA circulation protein